MKKSTTRSYNSNLRDQQAKDTRQRIADAARKLFIRQGYEGTTIEQIAESADVAAPTVYATFGSKKAIVSELVKQVRFGHLFDEFARKSKAPMAPSDRIKLIAHFVRNVNDTSAEVSQIFLLGKVSLPDIVKIEKERAALRYESQKKGIQQLVKDDALKPELQFEKARDILWSLTSPELFHLLTAERKWTSGEYESWLAESLANQLLR